jgi:hypothetical protein
MMVPQDADRHRSIIEHEASKIQQSSIAMARLPAAARASIPLSAIDRIEENHQIALEKLGGFQKDDSARTIEAVFGLSRMRGHRWTQRKAQPIERSHRRRLPSST